MRDALMAGAYSDDLREKVITAIERGEKKSQISRMFNISRDTIDRWLKRRSATGSVQAAQGYQRGHSHRISDWDEFRALAQTYGDKTLAEMAQLWQGDISERTMSRALAQIGCTRKKDLRRERERDEAKRGAFVAQLATLWRSQRVDVDESGMDERDDYGYGWCEQGKRFEALKSGTRAGRVNMIAACQSN